VTRQAAVPRPHHGGWTALSRTVAVALGSLGLLFLGSGLLLLGRSGVGFQGFVRSFGLAELSLAVTLGAVGGLLTLRRPRNPAGWLLAWNGLGLAAAFLAGQATGSPTVQALEPLVAIAGRIAVPLLAPIIGVLLLFPDGRVVSRGWKPVWWAVLATIVMTATLNPMVLGDGARPAFEIFWEVTTPLQVGALVAALVSLGLRQRRSGPTVRYQIRWVLAAFTAAVVLFLGGVLVRKPEYANLALNLIPISIAIAITRYRLFELDRLVSRTLAYGSVTVVAAVVYGSLTLIPTLVLGLGADTPDVAVAAATLGAAAVLRPSLRRIQRIVDRRFDRARYDATIELERFATHMRDELDPGAIVREVPVVVRGLFAPTAVMLLVFEGHASAVTVPERS
jgi:hypothetical protein